MKQRYLLLLLCLLVFQGAMGQTPVQIYVESFGTEGNGVRYTATAPAPGGTGIFQRASNPVASFLNPAVVTGIDADGYFWASEGEKTTATPQVRTLTLNPVAIGGYQNLQVNVAMADASQGFEPATPRWENNDYVRVKVRFTQSNGTVGPWVMVGQFVGDNPTPLVAGGLRQDTNLDGKSHDEPSAPVLTSALTDFSFPVSGLGKTVEVMVEMNHLGTSEEFAFDNIRLLGEVAPLSTNADLAALSLSSGNLAPAFASGTLNYTASVPIATTSITVMPTVSESNATVTVNGVTVTSGAASGAIALNVGNNTITTVVTAQDGTTSKSYTVTVTRQFAANNNNLSALSLSSGTLNPFFASATTAYTAAVSNATTSITVTPTVSDGTASVTVNGVTVASGNASGAIALSVGNNTISTVVTAQNSATKTYTVTVSRAASANANLANLTFSAGTLTPVFASGTTSYTAAVPNSITAITLTPTQEQANASITVNGSVVTSGMSSGSINLNTGANTITVVVTAQNGATKTYTLTVTRAAIIQWVGTSSTDWMNANNWSSGQVPGAGDVILIPAGASRFPVISSGTASALDLTIASGAMLTVTGGTLEVKGKYLNTGGTLSSTGGTVSFSGTSQQPVGQSGTNQFFNLSAGPEGIALSAPIEVRGVLRLEGNLVTNGNTLIIISDASSTGMVVNAGGSVLGSATVKRYIDPANPLRGYRHYSSPVTSTTFSDLSTVGFSPIVNEAFNALPAPALSSFTAATYPNVFEYDESRLSSTYPAFDIGWKSPASLSSSLVPGKGYTVLVPAAATVDLVGTLNNETVSRPLSRGPVAESGWHLLGNPFPGPLDWDLLNVPGGVYVFRSTGPGTGSYVSYNNGIGGFDGVLPMMQGFFYRATGAGTFNFTDAARLTNYANPAFKRKGPETRPLVELQLTAADGKRDQAFVYFERGATADFDEVFDAYKLLDNYGGQPTLYALAGAERLSISGQALSQLSATVLPLGVKTSQGGQHTFKAAKALNLDSDAALLLEDKATGALHDLRSQGDYMFTPSANDQARFFLHFSSATVTGIGQMAGDMAVSVYPNPASGGKLSVALSGAKAGKAEVSLSNAMGQPVQSRLLEVKAGEATGELNTSNLPAGVYLLRVTNGQHSTVRKVVLQ